jgi:membrane protein involved in colicin uptake
MRHGPVPTPSARELARAAHSAAGKANELAGIALATKNATSLAAERATAAAVEATVASVDAASASDHATAFASLMGLLATGADQLANEHAAEDRTADDQTTDAIRKCRECGDDIFFKACSKVGGTVRGLDHCHNGGSGNKGFVGRTAPTTDLAKRHRISAGFSTDWGNTGGGDSSGSTGR